MAKRYTPILPAPPAALETPAATQTPSAETAIDKLTESGPQAHKPKRSCDSKRPKCSSCAKRNLECIYTLRLRTLPEGQVEEIEALRQENGELRRRLKDVTRILRNLESSESSDSQSPLKSLTSPVSERLFVSAGSDTTDPRQTVVQYGSTKTFSQPAQNSLEFELMIRHPIAYPFLLPVNISSLEIESFLTRLRDPSNESTEGNPEKNSPEHFQVFDQDSKSLSEPNVPSAEEEDGSFSHSKGPIYCDDRLNNIEISHWTRIVIPNELAAHAISLYLLTDHPIIALFDANLFLDDLVHERTKFCSPLLVNALLCWTLQAFSSIRPEAALLSVLFYDETTRLYEEEKQRNPLEGQPLMTITATQLLSLACMCHGKEEESMKYLNEGIAMGKDIGLFDVNPANSARNWLDDHIDWIKAASYVAWGTFCWVTCRCLNFQSGLIQQPPTLPIPGTQIIRDSTPVPEPFELPSFMGKTFTYLCRFWPIANEMIWKYYDEEELAVSADRASLEFAEKEFLALLDWSNSLPLEMVRGPQTPHHAIIAHIYFHVVVTDLFRPFKHQLPHRTLQLGSFTAEKRTTDTVYDASVNQLKHLVLVYRTRFPSASYTMLWQYCLLYVANATLQQKEDDTRDSEWWFWFFLCIAGYQKLFPSFRVVESIVQGLLTMAISKGALTAGEGRAMMSRLRGGGQHAGFAHVVKGTFMVDLGMASTDPLAACVDSLSDKFDEMMLYDEYLAKEAMESVEPTSAEEIN